MVRDIRHRLFVRLQHLPMPLHANTGEWIEGIGSANKEVEVSEPVVKRTERKKCVPDASPMNPDRGDPKRISLASDGQPNCGCGRGAYSLPSDGKAGR